MEELLSLDDRVAVVTGSARGIGKEIARTFAAHGARVVISDVLEEEGRRTAEETGGGSFFVKCDVSSPLEARRLVDEVTARCGKIDILVNNAAYNPARAEERTTVDKYPDELFARVIDVDVNGTFLCSKYAALGMIERRSGCIINIASVAGLVALRNQIGHVVGKAAVARMTEAMALELGPHGIRVNAVSPGSVVTDATRPLFYGADAAFSDFAEKLLSFIPAGRSGQPADIACATLFLASDLSSYVNGHNIVVDGGWICGYNRDF